MLEEAYKQLIVDLEEAVAMAAAALATAEVGSHTAEVGSHTRPVDQILALSQMNTLLAFMHFLESTGSDERLLAPVKNLLGDLVDARLKIERGGAVKPIAETFKLASAAAVVSIMVERGTRLKSALKQVSKSTGLDADKLRSYRHNLRTTGWPARTIYDGRKIEARTLEDPLELLVKAPR